MVAELLWLYMISKACEFFEEPVRAYRQNRDDDLNRFHHTLMLFFAWLGVKNAPGGTSNP